MSGLVRLNVLNFIGGVSVLYYTNILKDLKWPLLPPQLSRFLKSDLIIRQVFLLLLVFIAIQLTKGDKTISIEDKVISSLFLYLFILLYPKQTLEFSLAEFIIFCIIYAIYYCIKNYSFNDEEKDTLFILMYVFSGLLGLMILTGNIFYYFKQEKDKGEKFSYLKFFFEVPNAKKS